MSTRSLEPPLKRFTSPNGRTFTVGRGEHKARWPEDPLWSDSYPILRSKDQVGTLFRNMNYSRGSESPTWQASLSFLRWRTTFELPRGVGFDIGPQKTAREALAAWGRNADEVLNFFEKEQERRERERTHFSPSEVMDLLR